jgi:hypothetical protein
MDKITINCDIFLRTTTALFAAPAGSILTLFHTQYFLYSVANTPFVSHYEEHQYFHQNPEKIIIL